MPLLSKWEEYLNQNPEGDIPGFARWVLAATPSSIPSTPGHTPQAPATTAIPSTPGHTPDEPATPTHSPVPGHTPQAPATTAIPSTPGHPLQEPAAPTHSPVPGHTPDEPATPTHSQTPGHPLQEPPTPSNPTRHHPSTPPEPRKTSAPGELDTTAQSLLLIDRLHRIVQFRTKPIVKNLGFTKPQEFSILVQTAIMNNPNKKQLCQEMLIEGSTGVEITRRLSEKGFLREKPDPADRRSALLSLTEKGKQTLLQGYTKLTPIHAGFLTTLSEQERLDLVSMLARLNEYHTSHLPPLS